MRHERASSKGLSEYKDNDKDKGKIVKRRGEEQDLFSLFDAFVTST